VTGLTFGAFDLLHYGHVRLLTRARERCDALIVAVSTDEYVHAHKGHYPAVPYRHRMELVKALKCVDLVIPQSLTFGKSEAVQKYRPDVLFVGSDWTPSTFGGEGLGVPVTYLPRTEGVSSTLLREVMRGETAYG
jgi:glycerol-3-phosphate cytidylyltransferase